MATTTVIAVPDLAGARGIGGITFWRLSGRVNLSALTQAWLDAGLDPDALPQPTSPRAALRSALRTLEGTRLLARPLENRGDYVLTEESVSDDAADTSYTKRLRVYLGANDDLVIEPAHHPEAENLRNEYLLDLSTMSGVAFGGWLVDQVEALRGVRLKDTGGVYYVPEFALSRWQRIAAVVQASTAHTILEIPAMSSQSALAAVTTALIDESENVLRAINRQLESGDLGERALRSRQNDCRAVQSKIAEYEIALGVQLDKLRERVQKIEAKVIHAAIAAQAAEGE
jgi:hypothetical protein